MSSFHCDICNIDLTDSDYGYMSGCKHYTPDVVGRYNCKVRVVHESGSVTVTSMRAFFGEDGHWKLDEGHEVLTWEMG